MFLHPSSVLIEALLPAIPIKRRPRARPCTVGLLPKGLCSLLIVHSLTVFQYLSSSHSADRCLSCPQSVACTLVSQRVHSPTMCSHLSTAHCAHSLTVISPLSSLHSAIRRLRMAGLPQAPNPHHAFPLHYPCHLSGCTCVLLSRSPQPDHFCCCRPLLDALRSSATMVASRGRGVDPSSAAVESRHLRREGRSNSPIRHTRHRAAGPPTPPISLVRLNFSFFPTSSLSSTPHITRHQPSSPCTHLLALNHSPALHSLL